MKNLEQFVADLKKSIKSAKVEIDISNENNEKLYYQKQQDRDFMKITKNVNSEIIKTFTEYYILGDLTDNPKGAFKDAVSAAAETYRDKVLDRFGYGKKDIPLRPLTLKYIKQKGNARVGINKGDLYRDLKFSKIKVVIKK